MASLDVSFFRDATSHTVMNTQHYRIIKSQTVETLKQHSLKTDLRDYLSLTEWVILGQSFKCFLVFLEITLKCYIKQMVSMNYCPPITSYIVLQRVWGYFQKNIRNNS